ncbi:MAG TPA: MmcB family DNA repair protein [Stellaceae bacterium]|jgi:hypothetical protein|nr:MmcB family DNA repair protein [Stellaceae bacterium]
MSDFPAPTIPNVVPSSAAPGVILARGVCRAFALMGQAVLTEVTLANGRRADILAMDRTGILTIIEVKSSIEDFRTDRKWEEYRGFCDHLYFAVPESFPDMLIPDSCGLIRADAFGAAIVRPARLENLAPARRKAVSLRFARLAAQRLQRLIDPGISFAMDG